MTTRRKALIAIAALVALGASTPALAQGACSGEPETYRIKVRVNNAKVPEGVEMGGQDASTVRVCPGDTIEWQFVGLPLRIAFNNGSPFDGELPISSNGKLSGTISESASGEYKYDVIVVGGGILDPIIIVD
ncbi:MAG: hypothetical protein P8102_13560 [Gammaproteobacteria bacterium]